MTKLSLENLDKLQLVRVSTCGSVDDGKSTLIGRLLYDCGAIFEDNLLSLEKTARKAGLKEVDFSLLLDGLSAEREQKITIDVAYRFFSTQKRRYIISDVPGHEQYTRNMVTGMSTANVALILIDATKGFSTQAKRHLFIASLLGVGHLLVIINKMDLVGYQEDIFKKIQNSVLNFARKLSIKDLQFMPVSSINGEMLKDRSKNLNWYKGETLIDYLENVYIESDINLIDLRFSVQTVIHHSHIFRGYAGRLSSGRITKGQKVVVYPGGRSAAVKGIYYDFKTQSETFAPQSTLVTLNKDLDISRGDMLVGENNFPLVGKNFQAIVFWMAEEPMDPERSYILKHTTRITRVKIEKLSYKFDVSKAKKQKAATLSANDIGKVSFSANDNLFFDTYDKNKNTGSFILIDDKNFNTVAAGIIIQKTAARDRDERSREGFVLWLTGLSGSGKSTLAEEIGKKLKKKEVPFEWLDGDVFRENFNFDLGFSPMDRIKNIQRAAYVARMLTKNGINVVGSFITPYESQRKILRKSFKNYVEVFVDAPLSVCYERDVKGHYARAKKREIKNFTGLHDSFEKPPKPAIHLDTDKNNIHACVKEVMDYLAKEKYI